MRRRFGVASRVSVPRGRCLRAWCDRFVTVRAPLIARVCGVNLSPRSIGGAGAARQQITAGVFTCEAHRRHTVTVFPRGSWTPTALEEVMGNLLMRSAGDDRDFVPAGTFH